jgi:hypothetical protein
MSDYIPQTWEDLPAQTTPIGAVRLQYMEDGIAGAIRKTNNLTDLADPAIARANLGLGTLATKNTVTSAEITDGTIVLADFAVNPYARANHTGTQLAVTISDFNTAVRLNRLDQMATPTALVNLGGQSITNLAAPVNPNDAVTKIYADSLTGGGGGIDPTVLDANTVLKADVDNTPVALPVGASTFVGRAATGTIAALTGTQAKTILGITTTDVSGLGALATKSTVTSADITDGTIVVADLAVNPYDRANHTGTQTASTISNFDTQVRTSRLDQMAAPTAPVGFGGQRLTNLATPTIATDAATMAYVDSHAGGGGIDPMVLDANTVLKADVNDTPVALPVGPSTVVGRAATGTIVALDATTARTVLGLGALATKSTVASADITDGTITSADLSPTAGIAMSQLAVDPLARANHTGTQLAATVSNFDAQVRTSRLDQMATPTVTVSLGGQSLTNLAAPVNPSDAVTKTYADALTPAGGAVSPATWDANSIVKADVDDTPVVLTVPASTFVGRGAAGSIAALTATAAKAVLAIANTDVTGLGALATKTTIADADIGAGAAIALSKLAVDPLARANHTGTQLAATISDFNTAVRLNRLDQMATPTASVALGGQTITGLGTPANPTDATTKAYVDGATVGGVSANLYDAFTVLRADVDNTPTALSVNPSTFVGRAATGGIVALDTTTAKATLAITTTDVSGLGTLATKSTIASADITDGTITSADIADATIVNADIALGAAIDLAKLAVDPLNRANHTGTQVAATVSNFDTQVRTSRLDQMAKPTAVVDANGQRITGVATPTGATDVTNKTYVDNVAAGLDFKSSVKACATVNVSLAAPGATIDGVTMASGNRVLLAGQTTASENGIWIWNGAAAAMTRATDADADPEVTSGMYVFVEGGTANGAKAFVLVTPDPIVLGTTPLSFTLFSGGGTSVVGTTNRITVTGTQIDISTAYVGQASITTLGTITTGVWNGTAIAVANGGTGATDATTARANLGITGGKFVQAIGNGALTSFTVTHNLNTKDITVEIYETATGLTVLADVTRTTLNAITVTGFTVAPTTNLYTVVVMG